VRGSVGRRGRLDGPGAGYDAATGAISMTLTAGRITSVLLLLIAALVIGYALLMSVFRDRLFDLYTRRLDTWVSAGGDAQTVQAQIVENCGKLVMSQPGMIEQFQLMTFYRDEFDFRVDVCVKLTANRVNKQPEFEKPETVALICDDPHPYHELFRRLCRKSGLRPAASAGIARQEK
jgi:hypothetical protein